MLAGACGPSPLDVARESEPLIQTDALRYELRKTDVGVEVEILYTFTNRTGATVFIVNCGGAFAITLQKEESGRWVDAWGALIPACLSPPININVGELFSAVLSVFGGDLDKNIHPVFKDENATGVYRIAWHDALSSYSDRGYPFGDDLQLAYRISNRFALVDPR